MNNVKNYQDTKSYHQSGITLFTTLDQQGHVGQITEQFPPQAYQSMSSHVPIIVLRVYTDQLGNAENLYPNLPESHPYVNLNSINLQSLLSNYMQAIVQNTPHAYQQQQQQQEQPYQQSQVYQQQQQEVYQHPQLYQQQGSYQQSEIYQKPIQQQTEEVHQQQKPHQQTETYQQSVLAYPQTQLYTQSQKTYLQHYEDDEKNSSDLETHENYPDDSHTKVIFHKQPKYTKTTIGTDNYNIPLQYNYHTQTVAPSYMYVRPEVTTSNYYYVEPNQLQQQQQQEEEQQQQYLQNYYQQYVAYQQQLQNQNNNNRYLHTVPQSKVEVLTHEGKGPSYLHEATTRNVRDNKSNKNNLRKKSQDV